MQSIVRGRNDLGVCPKSEMRLPIIIPKRRILEKKLDQGIRWQVSSHSVIPGDCHHPQQNVRKVDQNPVKTH
jgi:hypothetical protein